MALVARFRGKERTAGRDYTVRKLALARTDQLDTLASEAGRLYTAVLVEHWRLVRRHNVWLSEPALRQVSIYADQHSARILHSQSQQAIVSNFRDAMTTWRAVRAADPRAKPPHKRRRFYKVTWVQMAIRGPKDGHLHLSNGRGTPPLLVPWREEWGVPIKVEIGWTGRGDKPYELRATYRSELPTPIAGPEVVAAVDLGEIHPAVVATPDAAIVYNGRLLRSKRRYREKTKTRMNKMRDRCKPGSRRRKKLAQSKARQLRKIDNQIRDIEHKLTTRLVDDLVDAGVTKVVIGDVRTIRQSKVAKSKGRSRANARQKIHQAPMGRTRHQIEYKAARVGIASELQNEAYTSQLCLIEGCGGLTKSTSRRHKCSRCGNVTHRDGLGAENQRRKYHRERGQPVPGVVGAMAAPTGVRFQPHMLARRPRNSPTVQAA